MKTLFRVTLLAAAAAALPIAASAADAAENWKTMCAKCHGQNGEGKKPMKTRDYSDPAFQAGVTDAQLFDATKNGVPETKMPAYADKLADADITALVAHIRSFKKNP
jgi:cytochrome c553